MVEGRLLVNRLLLKRDPLLVALLEALLKRLRLLKLLRNRDLREDWVVVGGGSVVRERSRLMTRPRFGLNRDLDRPPSSCLTCLVELDGLPAELEE